MPAAVPAATAGPASSASPAVPRCGREDIGQGRGDRPRRAPRRETEQVPELPEIEALADHLGVRSSVRRSVALTSRVSGAEDFRSADQRAAGQTVAASAGGARPGPCRSVSLADHRAVAAGWLRWSGEAPGTAAAGGKVPMALEVHRHPGRGALLPPSTEAGTQNAWRVGGDRSPARAANRGARARCAGSRPRGPGRGLAGNSGWIKIVITDQKVIAGIGNADSDEILHSRRSRRWPRPGNSRTSNSPPCTT